MAFLIPDNLGSRKDVPAAARRVAQALQSALEDDSTVWFEPIFDPDNELPHFVVLVPRHGVVVLEVVKGKQGTILGAINGELKVEIDGIEQPVDNPLIRADGFATRLRRLFETDDGLRSVPVGSAAVFTGVERLEAEAKRIDSIVNLDRCVFKRDLDGAINDGEAQALLRVLAKSYDSKPLSEDLSPSQLDRLRALIHPDVSIPTGPVQGALFSAPTGSAEVLRVMDRKQEAMAKSLGSGHRVIRGVAGSGKTLVLVARARLIARLLPSQKILVTCFTKSLASQLRSQLSEHPNVEVTNLDSVMASVINRAGREHPGYNGDREAVARAALASLDEIPGPKYRAVLVDEAQDFGTASLKFCTRLFLSENPDQQDLVIVADSAQNIFRRQFRWKQAGIQAQGRTQILRVNYRNTREILRFAHEFLTADTSIEVDEAPDIEDSVTIIPAESAERSGPVPNVLIVDDDNAEIDAVVRAVKERLNHRSTARSVAVLYGEPAGNVDRGEALTSALESAGVPHFWATDKSKPGNKSLVGSADDPVMVSTIHSAKGLEFDYVIVCGLGKRSDAITARKLLYVGFTRAINELDVISARSSYFARAVHAASQASAV